MAKSIAKGVLTSVSELYNSLYELQQGSADVCCSDAGLAIGSGSKKKVKIVNAVYCVIDGIAATEAASTEVALSGTVVNATFNVFMLVQTSAGVASAVMGTAGASLAAVVFPAKPAASAVIGFVIINPTGSGNFVGATTDLDDGTVTPGAVYVNVRGSFNPDASSLGV